MAAHLFSTLSSTRRHENVCLLYNIIYGGVQRSVRASWANSVLQLY